MDLILATRNARKVEEIAGVFVNSNVRLLTLADAGIRGEAIEDSNTLEQNAFNKSWFAYEQSGRDKWVAADDTGLFITALNGEPGVRSARWAGEGASTEEAMRYCLARMNGIVYREAVFRTVVFAISPSGRIQDTFIGEIRGHLLCTPRVAPRPKMPYSALFVPEGHDRALAEMTIAEENAISHRGMAFLRLMAFLKGYSLMQSRA